MRAWPGGEREMESQGSGYFERYFESKIYKTWVDWAWNSDEDMGCQERLLCLRFASLHGDDSLGTGITGIANTRRGCSLGKR